MRKKYRGVVGFRPIIMLAVFIILTAPLACSKTESTPKPPPIIPLEETLTPADIIADDGPTGDVPPTAEADLVEESTTYFTVQMGAFSTRENAEIAADELISLGYDAFVFEVPDAPSLPYKVGIGKDTERDAADIFVADTDVPGYEGMWVTSFVETILVPIVRESAPGMDFDTHAAADGGMVYIGRRIVASEAPEESTNEREETVLFEVLSLTSGTDPVTVYSTDETGKVLCRPRISPDGSYVAFIIRESDELGGDIIVAPRSASSEAFVIPSSLEIAGHIWITPTVLAYVSIPPSSQIPAKIFLYNLKRGVGEVIHEVEKRLITDLSLSPDRRFLSYHATQGFVDEQGDESISVGVIDLETGSVKTLRPGFTTRMIGWLPGGGLMLAYHVEPGSGTSFEYTFATADPVTGEIVLVDSIDPVTNVGRGASSPNGDTIALFTWTMDEENARPVSSNLLFLSPTGDFSETILSHKSFLFGPVWSPDGETLAYTAVSEGDRCVFRITDLDDPNPERFLEESGEQFDIDWR
ncbi:MAG: SPOR domain-containing protein [Deltaproteobacteria bacterium]|nr:SPOR domain-containing protein [Candidatus Zymogenaceae bacterium]